MPRAQNLVRVELVVAMLATRANSLACVQGKALELGLYALAKTTARTDLGIRNASGLVDVHFEVVDMAGSGRSSRRVRKLDRGKGGRGIEL